MKIFLSFLSTIIIIPSAIFIATVCRCIYEFDSTFGVLAYCLYFGLFMCVWGLFWDLFGYGNIHGGE